jgi:hypothetical protein
MKKTAREEMLEHLEKGDFPGRDHNKGGQDESDMVRRKEGNIDKTGIRAMPNVKEWGAKGPNELNRVVKEQKKKSAKNEVEYTHIHPETGKKVTVIMTPRKLKNYQKKMKALADAKKVKKTAREEMTEYLEKGLNNAGLGGMKGAVLPSQIKTQNNPGNNSLAGKTGIPGITSPTVKDPMQQAQQIQNPDIKDMAMKEAQQKLVKPNQPTIKSEMIKFDTNGQWSLEKEEVSMQTENMKNAAPVNVVPERESQMVKGEVTNIGKYREKKKEQKHKKKIKDINNSVKEFQSQLDQAMRQGVSEEDMQTQMPSRKNFKPDLKVVKKSAREEMVEYLEKRCWKGYEPTPGKKEYEKGSCKPIKKKDKDDIEVAPEGSNNRETYKDEFEKKDIEVAPEGSNNRETYKDEFEKKEWSPKSKHKSDKGGLTQAGRDSYNKATGGNLKAPQPEGGPRKKSFCARNKGQIDKHNIDCSKTPEKRACKARKRWKC